MSETVHYRGKLVAVEKLENESLEDQCKRLLNNEPLDSFYDSYEEKLLSDNYQSFVVHDGILYYVEKKDIDPDDDIFIATKKENGIIDFEVKYYNGGCGFSEAIGYAFENLKEASNVS